MKHKNRLAYILAAVVIIITGCKKKIICDYETQCEEPKPNGFSVGTMGVLVNGSTGLPIPPYDVAVIYNTQNNASAPIGDDWNDPALGTAQIQTIHPAMWNFTTIGNVFGIALNNNQIYLSATDIYSLDGGGGPTGFGPAGRSGIYKTDFFSPALTTPLVTTLLSSSANTTGSPQIPNSGTGAGNSIGNIAYDKRNNQLFVTNLEDGRIYRINPTTGIVLSIFDPFLLDNGLPGMETRINETIWGIGVYTKGGVTSVYFARTLSATTKGIWSIPLTPTGEFAATHSGGGLYIDAPASSVSEIALVPGTQNKVTDIAFSSSGSMLLAERGNPHNSKVFEYNNTGSSWVLSTTNLYVGGNAGGNGENSAGGVAYSYRQLPNNNGYLCDDIIWATGNFMIVNLKPHLVYGVEGMSKSGNNPYNAITSPNKSTDIFIDYHGDKNNNYVKGKIGDIEFFDPTCPCK